MKNQRHAHGFKCRAFQIRTGLRCRGRQLSAVNVREPTAGALKNAAVFQDHREALSLQRFAWVLMPTVCVKSLTLQRSNCLGDVRLQTDQIVPNQ